MFFLYTLLTVVIINIFGRMLIYVLGVIHDRHKNNSYDPLDDNPFEELVVEYETAIDREYENSNLFYRETNLGVFSTARAIKTECNWKHEGF